jgi:hypothetical protein
MVYNKKQTATHSHPSGGCGFSVDRVLLRFLVACVASYVTAIVFASHITILNK